MIEASKMNRGKTRIEMRRKVRKSGDGERGTRDKEMERDEGLEKNNKIKNKRVEEWREGDSRIILS